MNGYKYVTNSYKYVTNIYKFIIAIIDVFLLICGLYLTILCLMFFGFEPQQKNIESLIKVVPYVAIATPIIFKYFGLFTILRKSYTEILYSLGLSVVTLAIITMALAFFLRGFAFPRRIIIIGPVTQFFILSAWRYFVWKMRRLNHGVRSIMIVGNKEETKKVEQKILFTSRELYYVYKIDFQKVNFSFFKRLEDATEIFLCPSLKNKEKSDIISYCLKFKKTAYIVPELYDIILTNTKESNFDDIPVFEVTPLELTLEQSIIKRTFDILFSILVLIIVAPIIILISLCVKLDSKGPVFYLQERVTRSNRVFKLIKFRTMISEAEKISGPTLAIRTDPRVTRLGKFLRSSRLDELPQLLNILIGHMSFVGPRPERPYFIEKFKKEELDYELRHTVKAGLTGFAQVHGKYSTNFADKLRYDLMYIRSYSLLLDITILFQTIKILFMKDKSEGVEP